MGGPAARNKALSYAQGDFIQWLDHDDLLAEDKIFNQLRSGEYDRDTRVLLSGICGTFYYSTERACFRPNLLYKDLEPIEYYLTKFEKHSWLHPSVWLVSRKLTEMAGPWSELKSPDDDGEYFCRVISTCEKIKFVPSARSYWRVGNFNAMNQKRSHDAIEALFLSLVKCINQLRDLEDSERTRKACLSFLQNHIIYLSVHAGILSKAHDIARQLGGEISYQESIKFGYLRKMIGWKNALLIKNITWRIIVMIRRNWDRFLFTLYKQCRLFF
jgi:glycosyltransferase involved in cell wall biosynthesis